VVTEEISVRRSSLGAFSLLVIIGLVSQSIGLASTGASSASASADAFVVRYCTHENYTSDPAWSSDQYLFVYSNGTATYRFIQNNQWGNSTTDWTSQLSAAPISKLYDTLIHEEFMSLNSSYTDMGWSPPDLNHTERACIEISGLLKTVTFYGRSMIGLIPGSYALLNNIEELVVRELSDLPDAALDIVVTEPTDSGPVAEITANFTNNGDTMLGDAGLCRESWPTYIVSVNGTTVGDLQNGSIPYCYMDFGPHTTTGFGPWEWNRTGLMPGQYVIMSCVVIRDYVIGNISANASWIPSDDHIEPGDQNDAFYLALAGLGIAAGAGVAAFYIIRIRGKKQ